MSDALRRRQVRRLTTMMMVRHRIGRRSARDAAESALEGNPSVGALIIIEEQERLKPAKRVVGIVIIICAALLGKEYLWPVIERVVNAMP